MEEENTFRVVSILFSLSYWDGQLFILVAGHRAIYFNEDSVCMYCFVQIFLSFFLSFFLSSFFRRILCQPRTGTPLHVNFWNFSWLLGIMKTGTPDTGNFDRSHGLVAILDLRETGNDLLHCFPFGELSRFFFYRFPDSSSTTFVSTKTTSALIDFPQNWIFGERS